MDEWYVQDSLDSNGYPAINGTPLNPLFEQMNRGKNNVVTSLDDHWDLDATADDNEAYEIEQDQIQ